MPGLDTPLHLCQAGREHLQPMPLLCTLTLVRVSVNTTHALTARDRQPLVDLCDGAAQERPLIEQAPQGELVLVLSGAGNRASPPGRRVLRQIALALRSAALLLPYRPDPHPLGQISTGMAAEVRADGTQNLASRVDTRRRSRMRAPRGTGTVNGLVSVRSARFRLPPPRATSHPRSNPHSSPQGLHRH
ncbi:hypothetical protein OG765_13055 [Streptomyces sp. NBC_00555]|uniref:hypothetical protein n=1 Tax=Streptomyces sp. NBC_00555 TaxID=2903662 RepID=UPI00225C149C|nr:hypothetical protein [Streptomyces sp. NBC_00555]MCX5011910.1 hypothetical protein [Streptomyces sp. NBC_00555]